MGNVVENGPGGHMLALDLDKVEIDGVKQQRERLQEHESRHEVVNLKHGMLALPQDEHPEYPRQQEQHGHHEVQRWQRHLSGGQVIAVVVLLNLNIKGQCHSGVVLVIGTTVKVQVVQALLLLRCDKDHELEGNQQLN